jgi:hypothetical protein
MIARLSAALLVLGLAVPRAAAELSAASFDADVVDDACMWLVQFHDDAAASMGFGETWSALEGSLKKLKTGSSSDGALAKKHAGSIELPAVLLFKQASAPPVVIAHGADLTGASMKKLRKTIFPHVKGQTLESGTFMKAAATAPASVEVNADGSTAEIPNTPLTPAVRTKRYFIYDVGPGERFNMRKAIVQRPFATVAALAKAEGGDDSWTLVLPPFEQFRSKEGKEPWAKFFDTQLIKAVWPHVIEFDEWVETVGKETGNRVDYVYNPAECPAEVMEQKNFDHQIFGQHIEVGSIKCSKEHIDADDKRLVKLLMKKTEFASVKRPRTVLVPSYEQISPPYQIEEKLRIQSALRFAPSLLAEAAKFQKEEMGGRKYVAMHLRRGDFLRNHAAHAPTLEHVVKAVRALADKAGVTDFYLATNGSPEEVASMKKSLAEGSPAIALHRFGSAYETKDVSEAAYEGHGVYSSLQVATIEQALASQALAFCGTLFSTFSMQIHFERKNRGFKWDDTDRTISPGPTLTPLCNYGDRPKDDFGSICNDCDFDNTSGKSESGEQTCMPW